MPTSETEFLGLLDVEASYTKGVKILRSISLEVTRKQIVCLIGPNGAGKSTILKAIMGLAGVESGSITLNGEEITGGKPHEIMRRGIAYVPQGRTVFPEMTVWENLRMGGFIIKDKRLVEDRIKEVFGMFPVLYDYKDLKAYALSGGEQQMLEMGRVLILDPKFMLIDEPSIGLAPKIKRLVFEKILSLNREKGIGILMVEQNAVQGLEASDLGYVLDMGRIRFSGSGVELLQDERIHKLYLGGGGKGNPKHGSRSGA
ncbi:MAG: ABC transporter ATP-binding protein [Desulfobacteraceae bacterium]|jgi:ABC-type branched-subunit amino acid transport system ATPase component